MAKSIVRCADCSTPVHYGKSMLIEDDTDMPHTDARCDEAASHADRDLLAESVIRDMAATVINMVDNYRNHPSFGYTKTTIRAHLQRMEGAVGMYMVMSGQAAHSGVPAIAEFKDPTTEQRVTKARREGNNV